MEFYKCNLAVLVTTNAALAYWRHNDQKISNDTSHEAAKKGPRSAHGDADAISRFKSRFLIGYVLAVTSDWLQGSYIYTLYKDTLGLPETTVAALFTTGFLSAALSAVFVGNLADRYGRRIACLTFCVLYASSCFTVLTTNISILFVGRILGGISATLLFSVFETWLVAEYNRLGFGKIEGASSLSSIFGIMSTLNGIAAIVSGVLSEGLVAVTGSRRAPFMGSAACLALASQIMLRYWAENYGEVTAGKDESIKETMKENISIMKDMKISTLGLTSCFFEGSMYIMVYFWSPTLISARQQYAPGIKEELPFGIIFANFMSAMMLGSFVFGFVTSKYDNDEMVMIASYLLQILLSLSASSLLTIVLTSLEQVRFWAFCVFELCVGMYFPCMGYLKSNLIEDGIRGKVYGLMRLPLNVFVVLTLSSTREGDSHRENVFIMCSIFLLASMYGVQRMIYKQA